MTDAFRLNADFSSGPAEGSPSAWSEVIAPVQRTLNLGLKTVGEYALVTGTPISVNFGGLDRAHVVVLAADDGAFTAKLTSIEGAEQLVPVSPLLVLFAESEPVTAIDLVPGAGVSSVVRVFLGKLDTA